ncbi:Predicted DNA-binding protein, MmcQ/YjbR family [Clostridium cavendishii DSM 21758]|uniref:Predicted DNA-binding protein, MmcQ/YjbR family n=1 Tax=Clostridium cavendishii DSM 21758 TaxID=1121302 RepID=A0A1M6EGL4_9CLOT|nr:MmcQ/YjbR family DNA-binding protein [Clostridium cavendishii]SHI84657.1 Predicted DNA-binding protein, MmcQ/YjbR family [Clostridium cavendishii DSM 21758]
MEEFCNYCLSLPKTIKDYPFGEEPLVIKVNNKMFALINENHEISLKCEPFRALEYREMFNGVRPGYHLNKKHWNTINIDSDVPKEIIKAMIKESYEAVVKTFSKKEREEIYIKLK